MYDYDIEQLCSAQSAVYVMSNPDGSDHEFLPLAPKASASDLEQLRARWAGRDLQGVGVAFSYSGNSARVSERAAIRFHGNRAADGGLCAIRGHDRK